MPSNACKDLTVALYRLEIAAKTMRKRSYDNMHEELIRATLKTVISVADALDGVNYLTRGEDVNDDPS